MKKLTVISIITLVLIMLVGLVEIYFFKEKVPKLALSIVFLLMGILFIRQGRRPKDDSHFNQFLNRYLYGNIFGTKGAKAYYYLKGVVFILIAIWIFLSLIGFSRF